MAARHSRRGSASARHTNGHTKLEVVHAPATTIKPMDPNIYVNVWPGDEICNGIMQAQRFTHFACGKWTTPPARDVPHPVKKPHAITQSPEFKADVVEFDNWFRHWEREGRPDLVPDPTDVRRHL